MKIKSKPYGYSSYLLLFDWLPYMKYKGRQVIKPDELHETIMDGFDYVYSCEAYPQYGTVLPQCELNPDAFDAMKDSVTEEEYAHRVANPEHVDKMGALICQGDTVILTGSKINLFMGTVSKITQKRVHIESYGLASKTVYREGKDVLIIHSMKQGYVHQARMHRYERFDGCDEWDDKHDIRNK